MFAHRTASTNTQDTQPEKTGSERRWANRRPGSTPALIYLEGVNTSVPCMIRDTSTTGARLEMREGWSKPLSSDSLSVDRLRLVIRHDRVMYDCLIVRRGDSELGVKFLSAPKPIVKRK